MNLIKCLLEGLVCSVTPVEPHHIVNEHEASDHADERIELAGEGNWEYLQQAHCKNEHAEDGLAEGGRGIVVVKHPHDYHAEEESEHVAS